MLAHREVGALGRERVDVDLVEPDVARGRRSPRSSSRSAPLPALTDPENSLGVSALRAGCALTSIAVTASTAMPSTHLAGDRPAESGDRCVRRSRRPRCRARRGAPTRRLRTIERLTAATPTSATTIASLTSRMWPYDVPCSRGSRNPTWRHDAKSPLPISTTTHQNAMRENVVERAAQTAAEPAAERGDEQHDQPAEPHAHREHVDRVERDREDREIAGGGVAGVAGCRREADRATAPPSTSHHSGARRPRSTRADERAAARARRRAAGGGLRSRARSACAGRRGRPST